MKRTLLIIFIVAILVGTGAFYGGVKYGQSTRQNLDGSRQVFQNLSPGQRQQLFQGNIGEGFQGEREKRMGQNLVGGEVIGRDEQSLTLKMLGGGSKIVFFSDSTEISKTIGAAMDDIEIGKQIMVSGEQNPDGSYTAKTIQLLK